jgi:hypothetical protein
VIPAFTLALAVASPSADEYYRAAFAQMRDVREPAFVTYRADIPAGNSTLVVRRGTDGRAALVLEAGGTAPANHWQVAYRASDRLASIPLADGTHVLSSLALFDPTWNGVYEWMRHGLTASAETVEPAVAASAAPQASALPVIAVVSAMSPGNYTIEDAGPGDCDGHPGHALRLTAKHDASSHPLTGVTIDLATQRFCRLRFALRAGNVAGGVTGTVELHFGDVGGYYLVTGGTIEGAVRSIGIAVGHFATSFAYTAMAFPPALPGDAFVP